MGEVGCLKDGHFQNLQVEGSSILNSVARTAGSFVVSGGTTNQNNLLTGSGTANNASLSYGSSVLGIIPNAHGSGITNAAINTFVDKIGGTIVTTILIDLHGGLADGGSADDIIGTDGGVANAYIGELTSAVNGVPMLVEFACTEVPAGGDPDINLVCSATATDANDAAVTTPTVLLNNGDLTLGFYASVDAGDQLTATKKYLYLTCGDTTDALYTAGKLWIRITGSAVDFAG